MRSAAVAAVCAKLVGARLLRDAEGSFVAHVFGRVCAENAIEHRLTKPYHPWTNGQAERMVRTIKDATVRAFHYASI